MTRTVRKVVGAAALGVWAGVAAGQVFDVRAQWSDAANPNGAWSYRAGEALLPHVGSWQPGGFPAPQPAWATGAVFGEPFLPAWMRMVGPVSGCDWIAGDVGVHTWDPGNGGSNGEAQLVWTSPVRGLATIAGGVWMGRDIGRGNTWTLRHNGAAFTGGTVSSGDPYSRANPFPFSAGSAGPGVVQDRPVLPGDRLSLLLVRTTGAGDFVMVDMTVTVCAGISAEPQDVRRCGQGGTAQFSVAAQGVGDLAYRWRVDGTPIPVSGPGANPSAATPTLEVPVEPATQGAYDCVVTGACGSITSLPARLLVCVADFNCDGVANSTDVSDFINQWFTDQQKGSLVTDIDGNGVVNSTDVSEFINRWFEDVARGCG